MAVITVGTEKGGTGKTTLVWGLGGALHAMGRSVLYVDMDGQRNLSRLLRADGTKPTIYEILKGMKRPASAIQRTYQGDLMAASAELSGLDGILTGQDRELRLKKALEGIAPNYDYVLIDTPPALGMATVNALAASDGLIIPVTTDLFAVYGMNTEVQAARDVQATINPRLEIIGISVGLWDPRTAMSKAYLPEIEKRAAAIPCPVYGTKIRRGVAVLEAESACRALADYAPRSNQAKDYRALAEEVDAAVRS